MKNRKTVIPNSRLREPGNPTMRLDQHRRESESHDRTAHRVSGVLVQHP